MRKLSKYLLGIVAVVAIATIGSFPAFALGASPMALVAAATTAATPFATQVKLLAISGSVYALLQVVKQVFPLAGLGAILSNVALSVLGVVVVIKPEDLFSLNTLTLVGIAAITAAGAHGTIKSFTSGGTDLSNPGPGANTTMRSGVAMLLCVALIGLTGCSSLERQAYNVIVGSKAFTKSFSDKHPECGTRDANGKWIADLNNQATVCVAIKKGIAAKDLLIDAAEEYCASSDFDTGGACNPPSSKTLKDQLAAKVQAAITGYQQAETDLRALIH
jgi:hypothetical protein